MNSGLKTVAFALTWLAIKAVITALDALPSTGLNATNELFAPDAS